MNNRKKIALILVFIFLGLLTEKYILWLFPNTTGFLGIICWPMAIIFSLMFGILTFAITKKLSILKTGLIVICLFFIQTIFLFQCHPQESSDGSLTDYINAYRNYDNIESNIYPTTGLCGNPERVIIAYKLKNKMPISLIRLTIDSAKYGQPNKPVKYLIENKNGVLSYDTNRLKLIICDTSTIIIEINKLKKDITHIMHKKFLETENGGIMDSNISIMVYRDNFSFKTGAEKTFFKIISKTK